MKVEVNDILDFWFGTTSAQRLPSVQTFWFRKSESTDSEIRARFSDAYEAARDAALEAWRDSAEGSLALILILDQFPRNMFRNSPLAFATDGHARGVAREALSRGFDVAMHPLQRWFMYMPFEHSENRDDQNLSVNLFEQLANDPTLGGALDYACRHRDVIARFGRFPHRNAALGRVSTPEERAFLAEPGSSF